MQSSRFAGSPIDIAELISGVTIRRAHLKNAFVAAGHDYHTPARHSRRSSAQMGENPQPYTVLSNGPPRLKLSPWIAIPPVTFSFCSAM
jgi:hypothetical protein